MPYRPVQLACCLALCVALVRAQPRLAIIGGGVAGASAAYYARQQLPEAEIHVYERGQLGGRAKSEQYDGVTLELGGSIIWHKNYLMKDLAAAAGLEVEEPPADGLLALYDGRQLVFAESQWRILTLIRMLLRYWLSWFSFRAAPAAVFQKFEGIYPLLDNNTIFERPEKLLQAVGLYELTQVSMFEHLRETYGSTMDLLGRELIAGVNRVNYNQNNLQLNALAGHISMLPATEPQVFRIEGGNAQLAPAVLAAANASVRSPAAVDAVEALPGGRFQLLVRQGSCAALEAGGAAGQGGKEAGPYDAVVLAAPLEGSGLRFPGLDLPVIPARKYQHTVATFVKGAVRPSYFGLAQMDYAAVMVTEAAAVPWSSLSLLGRTATDNATLWKLFSSQPLPHAWTEMMFEAGYEVVAVQAWDAPGAYPAFDPPEDFAPFRLGDGLFYAAALESAASAMEIAAIEGRLVAAMAARHVREAAQRAKAGRAAAGQQGGTAVLQRAASGNAEGAAAAA